MKVAVAFVVAIAVAVAMWMAYRGDAWNAPAGRDTGNAATAGRSGPGLAPDAVLAIKPSASSPQEKAVRLPVSPLMQEYRNARRLPEVYARIAAKANPSPEELYVKALIVMKCVRTVEQKAQSANRDYPQWTRDSAESRERFAASLPSNAPGREKRIAAFESVNADRCEGMPQLEASDREVRAMLESAAVAGDAKARVALVERTFFDSFKGPDGKPRRDIAVPPAPPNAQALLQEAARSGDAEAVAAAFRAFALPFGDLSVRGGEAQLPIDDPAWRTAANLLGCELGLDCGPESEVLLRACAMHGYCDVANVRDYQFFYALSPASSQMVEQYVQAMRQARQGDWSWFTFHPGPAPTIAGYRSK